MVYLKQKAPARDAFIFNILFPADGNGAFKVVVNEFFNFGGLIDFLQLLNARVGGIFLFGYKNVDVRGSSAFNHQGIRHGVQPCRQCVVGVNNGNGYVRQAAGNGSCIQFQELEVMWIFGDIGNGGSNVFDIFDFDQPGIGKN